MQNLEDALKKLEVQQGRIGRIRNSSTCSD